MFLKAYKLFIDNFSSFIYLAIPAALSNLFMVFYLNNIIIKNTGSKSIHFLIILLYIMIIIIFSISIYCFAFNKLNNKNNIFIESIGRTFTRLIHNICLYFILNIIMFLWFIISLIPLIIKLIIYDRFSPILYFYSGFLFLSIVTFLLWIVVPFIFFSIPDINIKDKVKLSDSLFSGNKILKGKRVKGLIYLIFINLIELVIILLFFYISFLSAVLINNNISFFANPLLIFKHFDKFNLYIGFISSVLTLLLFPYRICLYVLFYKDLIKEPEIKVSYQENKLEEYLSDVDIN